MAAGTFTAPFDGVYGFFFFAYITADNGGLYAKHNDNQIFVFNRYSASGNTNQAYTVYFAVAMKQNDKVKMYSGSSDIHTGFFAAKFSGFLIQS